MRISAICLVVVLLAARGGGQSRGGASFNSGFGSNFGSGATRQQGSFQNQASIPRQQGGIQNTIAGQGPQRSNVNCPEKNGRFPIGGQCDAYIECEDGVGTEKLCPDGLLFNAKAKIFAYPCQYPVDVDCEGRSGLQPAQPTDDCPHQYGYFKLGDVQNCGQFINCVDGRGYTFDCPEGLAFNPDTLRCDWPDQVDSCDAEESAQSTGDCPRKNGYFKLGDAQNCGQFIKCIGGQGYKFDCPEGLAFNPDILRCDWPDQVDSCDAEAFLGFRCPESDGVFTNEVYQFYRSPANCQKYFICVGGRPRLYSCDEDEAFNEDIRSCDGIENVTACARELSKAAPVKLPPRF